MQMLLEARKKGNFLEVDNGLRKRISRRSSRVKTKSPNDADTDRIIEDYGDEDLLNNIVNRATAKEALDDLRRDDNLSNYVDALGVKNFEDYLFDKFVDKNIKKLIFIDFKLKSGKQIRIYRANERVYIRQTKAGLRAYSFSKNRFTKMPKNIFGNI